jgi:hypothetical protein
LCFLKEQREKWIDDTQTFMTNNATVDKWLIDCYHLDSKNNNSWVSIPVIDWIDKLIENLEKKIKQYSFIETSTAWIDDLPF